MRKYFLITIGLSAFFWADFVRDNATSIVTDNSMGLQWQDNETVKKDWKEAIDYCEALALGGHSDWRLPNINELTSIVDPSRAKPAIATEFQNTSVLHNYVSSTTSEHVKGDAWFVSFRDGDVDKNAKTHYGYVRCVRGGK